MLRGRAGVLAGVEKRGALMKVGRGSEGGTRRRVTTARFGDVRLWLGIALVGACMVAGIVVMRAGSDTVLVLQATRDLPEGAPAAALQPVAVSRAVAGDAYLTDRPADGTTVRRAVHAGELVPATALASVPPVAERQVTVPVDPLHAPIDLQPGDRVDVWGSPASALRDPTPPHLVVANARVASVSADPVGVGGELAVVLDLDTADVAATVAAARTEVVDLVAVPLDSQPVGNGSEADTVKADGDVTAAS